MKASRRLLSDRRTKSCGGGVVVPTATAAKPNVLSSDVNGMKLRVELPAVQFVEKSEGGKSWTKLVLPNTDARGSPGSPGIPVSSSVIAVPDGATMKVTRPTPTPTRSTASSCFRSSPSRSTRPRRARRRRTS